MPTNPNTPGQQTIREAFGLLTNRWANLSGAQRDAWNVYASNVPLPDRLGEQRLVSGQNQYVRSNTPRLGAGLAIIDTAPADFNVGVTPSLAVSSIDDAGSVNVTIGPGTPGAAGVILCYVSRPQNPTINYFRGPYVLFMQVPFTAPGTTPVTQGDASPFTMTAGQRVFVRAQTTLADGRLSSDTQANDIVIVST